MTNIEALDLFERYLREEKKSSENTTSNYLRDIRQMSEYIADNFSLTIETATEDSLQEYISFLRDNGKSVATVSRNIASIKCMYTIFCIKQYLKVNPSLKLVPDKCTHKLPDVLSVEEVDKLLSQPRCVDAKGYRDKAMLELMCATGMRVSELLDLNIMDVSIQRSEIKCKSKNKERTIPIYDEANKALDDYISLVRPQMINKEDENALFVNVSGDRMSRQGFWKIIKFYTNKGNINKDITPHTLRHSFAAHLIQKGTDLESLKNIMGHADISSTQMYTSYA